MTLFQTLGHSTENGHGPMFEGFWRLPVPSTDTQMTNNLFLDASLLGSAFVSILCCVCVLTQDQYGKCCRTL